MDPSINPADCWCDSRCERCPLADDCRVCSDMEHRRWQHLQNGDDPDDWEVITTDVTENLKRALAMLCELAEQEGISLDELDAPRPPRAPADERLVAAARDYLDAAHALSKACCSADLAAEMDRASLVYVKIGRITGMGEIDDDEMWLADSAPNLLLIERVMAEVSIAAGRLVKSTGADAGPYLRATQALIAELQPQLQRIPRGRHN